MLLYVSNGINNLKSLFHMHQRQTVFWNWFVSVLFFQVCITADKLFSTTSGNRFRREINIIGDAQYEQSSEISIHNKMHNCVVDEFHQFLVQNHLTTSCKLWKGNDGPTFTKIVLKITCYPLNEQNVHVFQRILGSKDDGVLLLQSTSNSIEFLINDYSTSSAIILKMLNSKMEVFSTMTLSLHEKIPVKKDLMSLLSLMKCFRNKDEIFLMSQVANIIYGQLLESKWEIRNALAKHVLHAIDKVKIKSRIDQIILSSFIPMLSKIMDALSYQEYMLKYCEKVYSEDIPETTIQFYYFVLRVNEMFCKHVQRNQKANLFRERRDTEEDNEETTTEKEETESERAIKKYHRLDEKSVQMAKKLKAGDRKMIEDELLISKKRCADKRPLSWSYKDYIVLKLFQKNRFCKDLLLAIIQVPPTVYEDDKAISIPVYNIKIAHTSHAGKGKTWKIVNDEKIDFRADRVILPSYTNITHNVTMPKNKYTWTNDLMLKQMAIHRLDCFQDSFIYIRFYLDEDVKLEVIVAVSHKPNEEDLNHMEVVDSGNDSSLRLELFENLEENKWVYLGILPHKDMAKGGDGNFTAPYKLEVSSRTCMIFDETSYQWIRICEPGEDDTKYLICVCNHTSFITAEVKDVYSRVDAALSMEVELSIANSNIIFYFVAFVVLCYCIAISFDFMRASNSTGQDNLFVVADNFKNERYGYMMNIRTANASDAGTTSNVAIQLKGSLCFSRRHVLNYPDPEKRLLDSDTTQLFILGTRSHLGNIISVKLWFDSIGQSPSWWLKTMDVIDLQTRDMWSFSVSRWLDVTRNAHKFKLTLENCFNDESNKAFWNFLHFYFGWQNLWNIFNRSHDIQFSYKARLTIILSQILNTYAVALIFLGTPTLKIVDGFYMGEVTHPFLLIRLSFIVSAICFGFNNGLAFTMRYSCRKFDENNIYYETNFFPHKADKYSWILTVISIMASLIYLVFFGFWVPQVKAYMWLITTTAAICISVFIYESLFLSIWNILLFFFRRNNKLINHRIYNFDLIFECIEKQRSYIYSKFGEFMLRPYLRHLYAPLDHSRLQAKRLLELKRTEVAHLFKDMILFIIYVFVLYLFAFLNTNKFMYRIHHEMELKITKSYNESGRGLAQIDDYTHMYSYLEDTVLSNLHGNVWYGSWVAKEGEDDGKMYDFKGKLLGVILIRQFRRQKPDCELPYMMQHLRTPCLLHGKVNTEHNHSRRQQHHSGPMWEFVRPENSDLPSVRGELMTYPKGGFYTQLGRTWKQSRTILKRMKKQKWIDIETKALILHYWTYNPYVNLFNLVQIVIEHSSTGYMIANYEVITSYLIFVSYYRHRLLVIFLILLSILIANRFVMGFNELLRDRHKFFKNVWNYVDVILLACTSIMIADQLLVQARTSDVLERMNNAPADEFVNFMSIADHLTIARILRAFTVCLATVRLWKSLRFGILFRIMETTLLSAGTALLLSFFYVFFIMFGFSSLTYSTFGRFSNDIRNLIEAYIYIILKSLQNKNVDMERGNLRFINVAFGSTIIYGFLLTTLTLYKIITVIIIMHYEHSKDKFQHIQAVYTVKQYITSEFYYYIALIFGRSKELRLRGGGETISSLETIYPKRDSRYAKSITLQQDVMDRMTIIARLSIRRQDRIGGLLTKADYLLMNDAILKHRIVKERRNQQVIFFHSRDREKVTLVSNERLLQIEAYVRRILVHTRAEYETEEGEEADLQIPARIRFDKNIKAAANAQRLININKRLLIMNQCIRNIDFVATTRNIE